MTSLENSNDPLIAAANHVDTDFSLLKVEAPTEYSGLGKSLTPKRRQDAEYGLKHQTARKLGALFEQVLPQTPRLVSAYGQRASEIIQNPDVNPSQTERLGPFADFAGVDGSSIWAAATSGASSIALHLLACLLARAFDAPKATSIWIELIIERKREILKSPESSKFCHSDLEADYPREELRLWDASARSWLRSADAAMFHNQTQMQLILENIQLSITSESSVYESVMSAWCQGLLELEKLLSGEPQTVTGGVVMLALSAWHLYPDLIILESQPTEFPFTDPLIPSTALVTIDMSTEFPDEAERRGIYWSLALSHYRSCKGLVQVESQEQYRFTIEQLHMVALGSLLKRWDVMRGNYLPACRWLVALWECVTQGDSEKLPWLRIIANAAERLIESQGDEKIENQLLFDFGYRRGRNFLTAVGEENDCLPWFGLRMPHILPTMTSPSSSECGIQYLRMIAQAGCSQSSDALISVISERKATEYHEYTTAIPHKQADPLGGLLPPPLEDDLPGLIPDTAQGDETQGSKISVSKGKGHVLEVHRRWSGHIKSHGIQSGSYQSDRATFGDLVDSFNNPSLGGSSSEHNEYLSDIDALKIYTFPETGPGMRIRTCDTVWVQAPRMFSGRPCEVPCTCLDIVHLGCRPAIFDRVLCDERTPFRLWIRKDAPFDSSAVEAIQSGHSDMANLEDQIRMFQAGDINCTLLRQYLDGIDPFEDIDDDPLARSLLQLMGGERQRFRTTITSLRNLALASRIYEHLHGVTVSSSVVETHLASAKWGVDGRDISVTRPLAFSCIAMMGTGTMNIAPEMMQDVMAASSGNSIFVTSALVNDPSKSKEGPLISRIIGNIGRPGISLLVPPAATPRMRSLDHSSLAVRYEPFDRKCEDAFHETSLHLSLNNKEIPIEADSTDLIDFQVTFAECVVSVHDRGQWVADLNILKVLDEHRFDVISTSSLKANGEPCSHSEATSKAVDKRFVSISSWDELMDECPGVGVVKANGNWSARLAAATLLAQIQAKNGHTGPGDQPLCIISPNKEVCWECVIRKLPQDVKADSTRSFYLID